jgi:hypothetical protein
MTDDEKVKAFDAWAANQEATGQVVRLLSASEERDLVRGERRQSRREARRAKQARHDFFTY